MGQRSQIYVKYPVGDEGKYGLIANYYQWNYGERMISRAAHTIAYLKSKMEYGMKWWFYGGENVEKLRRYLDVNFDMNDIVMSVDIIKEWMDFDCGDDCLDYVFHGQENNDGCLFLNLVMMKDDDREWCEIHYCFTTWDHEILDAQQYMEWESETLVDNWRNIIPPDAVEICDNNMKFIMENAVLMTKDELENMMDFPYENIPRPF